MLLRDTDRPVDVSTVEAVVTTEKSERMGRDSKRVDVCRFEEAMVKTGQDDGLALRIQRLTSGARGSEYKHGWKSRS
jgi:hypothetical protein